MAHFFSGKMRNPCFLCLVRAYLMIIFRPFLITKPL